VLDRPLVLAADNFTPLARTPWAGRFLRDDVKRGLVAAGDPVGESWEVSFGPELPSRLADGSCTLAELAMREGAALSGREHARGGSALLVKLLDTAEALSVQIHPFDDDPALAPDESGKPESWYVVRAEPDAAIYLGLTREASLEAMQDGLARGADVSALLHRIPVSAGDFFVVAPGTPHAIGAGVTLVEPQRVLPGRKGLTYRYWDWNRTYDARGVASASGAARELHVARALAVTRWDAPRGDAFLDDIHRKVLVRVDGPLLAHRLAGGTGLAAGGLDVAVIAGTGERPIRRVDAAEAWVVVEGELALEGAFGSVRVARGMSALVPACVGPLHVRGEKVHAVVSSIE
jgi:mannose-6-phosphate isomerase class I